MKSKNLSTKLAKPVSSVLKASLHVSANTASCGIIHQPKEPKNLDKFKKIK